MPEEPEADDTPAGESAEDPEPDSEVDADDEWEPTEEQLQRLAAALANLDEPSLKRALTTMREQSRLELAQQLNLSKATMHLGDALVPLARRKIVTANAPRRMAAAFALAEQTNEETIAALGDRSEDPTRADMLEILPGVIEHQGLPLVTLMLASYAASDAKCQAVCSELLDDDERFALPDTPEIDAEFLAEPTGIETFTATRMTPRRPRSERPARRPRRPSARPRRAGARRPPARRPHASRPSTGPSRSGRTRPDRRARLRSMAALVAWPSRLAE